VNRLPVALLVVLLAGCSSTSSAQAVTGCASSAPGTVAVTAAVHKGRAEPAPHRVEVPLGSPVMVRVEADTDAEVHIHGYELETGAEPGSPGCVTFVADRTGVFDVEAHPETLLVQLEVR
jgi:hypothetical protein